MNRSMLFSIMYALAAVKGRDRALFGSSFATAQPAFARSLQGKAFPEVWFEIPMMGDPWFDLHVLTARDDLDASEVVPHEGPAYVTDAFEWFAAQGGSVRQLALSWDIGSAGASAPAVQLLVRRRDDQVTTGFLEAVGRTDAASSYQAFLRRLPPDWFACYTGVFPDRLGSNIRVECIPSRELSEKYAQDPALLAEHLHQVGLQGLEDTLLPRCQLLASMPFQLEFQFDVKPDGSAGPTFAASVRFPLPAEKDGMEPFDVDGAAGELFGMVESWGLADSRWRLLGDVIYAKRIALGPEAVEVYCYPAFLKLRWRDGAPLDAKVYLIASTQ